MKFNSIFLFICLYIFWRLSQKVLSTDIKTENSIIDRLHDFYPISTIHNYLAQNLSIMKFLLISTSLLIDVNVICLVIKCIYYKKNRIIFVLISGLICRQLCQFINRLPIPANMLWFDPGIPSILVTYDVSNDFFFSGHTFISLVAGFEIMNSKYLSIKLYGLFFMIYEIFFVIVIHGHYFMDIYAAIATYFMLNDFARRASSFARPMA